jgi:hypothetical protein
MANMFRAWLPSHSPPRPAGSGGAKGPDGQL